MTKSDRKFWAISYQLRNCLCKWKRFSPCYLRGLRSVADSVDSELAVTPLNRRRKPGSELLSKYEMHIYQVKFWLTKICAEGVFQARHPLRTNARFANDFYRKEETLNRLNLLFFSAIETRRAESTIHKFIVWCGRSRGAHRLVFWARRLPLKKLSSPAMGSCFLKLHCRPHTQTAWRWKENRFSCSEMDPNSGTVDIRSHNSVAVSDPLLRDLNLAEIYQASLEWTTSIPCFTTLIFISSVSRRRSVAFLSDPIGFATYFDPKATWCWFERVLFGEPEHTFRANEKTSPIAEST